MYKINIQLFPQEENLNINIFNANRFLIVPIPLPRDKLADENIVAATEGKNIVKVIVIKGRLVNIVVK